MDLPGPVMGYFVVIGRKSRPVRLGGCGIMGKISEARLRGALTHKGERAHPGLFGRITGRSRLNAFFCARPLRRI